MTRVRLRDPYAWPATAGRARSGERAELAPLWAKGQLHVHTSRSFDGRMPPEAVVRAYRELGFHFICITDHDRLWTGCAFDQGLLVVPGEESTLLRPFPPLGRHLLRLFVRESVPALARADRKIALSTQQGALLAAAHPAWSGNLGTGRWQVATLADSRLMLVEIVNHHSPTRDNVALWDAALAARGADAPLWATGVDDSHRSEQIGRAWVWVRLERPLDAFPSPWQAALHLRAALASGAFYPSTGARARFGVVQEGDETQAVAVEVERSPGTAPENSPPGVAPHGSQQPPAIRFFGARGHLLHEAFAWQARYAPRGGEGYVRVEVTLHGGQAAWSQPFWLVERAP
ncbi:MAG: PHP domain-containing protein [Bacillota bacterium]